VQEKPPGRHCQWLANLVADLSFEGAAATLLYVSDEPLAVEEHANTPSFLTKNPIILSLAAMLFLGRR
jgi:hypothetical protein